jgi:hypothetical protein
VSDKNGFFAGAESVVGAKRPVLLSSSFLLPNNESVGLGKSGVSF